MINLLQLLIIVSEKAANIARTCRHDQNIFTLLVQEKNRDEANARFVQDFKTLADVLIQETVRHDIEKHFPVLSKYTKGEEDNTFTNQLGETITVRIQESENETAKLLEKVLDGNTHVATILAAQVHKNVIISQINLNDNVLPTELNINPDNLGIWIDPVDSTGEYISGKEIKGPNDIYLNGLQCVTVLIGVYERKTGLPIIGVINQPFHEYTDNRWKGKCYWSVVDELSSTKSISPIVNRVVLSKIELAEIKSKLLHSGYEVIEAAGAGYKLLTVATGLVDAYIVTQGTTFRWDVCGPHAILRSFGGGVFDYTKVINGTELQFAQIDYKEDTGSNDTKINKYCNKGGLIAVRNESVLHSIVQLLQN